MGIRLIVEVLDHAPADLSLADRLVLVVIAEQANDTTREAWPGLDLIARRARVNPAALRRMFRRWAARRPPLEVRVALGIGKDGRPYYSAKGHRTVYRVPILASKGETVGVSPLGDAKARRSVSPLAAKGDTRATTKAIPASPQRRHPRVSPFPHEPSVEPSSPRARTRAESLLADAGATDDEMKIILEKISSNGGVRNQGAYVAALIRNGDLAAMLAELRQTQSEEADRARRRRFMQSLEGKPPCVHGTAGGHIQEEGGWMLCALGRRNVAAGLSADGGVI